MLWIGDQMLKFLRIWGRFLIQTTTSKKTQRNATFNHPSRKKNVIMTTISKSTRTLSSDQIFQLYFYCSSKTSWPKAKQCWWEGGILQPAILLIKKKYTFFFLLKAWLFLPREEQRWIWKSHPRPRPGISESTVEVVSGKIVWAVYSWE